MGTEEREISIADLLYRVCLKWRLILLWMVAGMAAMGLFGYYRYKKVSAAVAETQQETKDAAVQEEALRDALRTSQIETVEQAVETAAEYEALCQKQELYLNNSILMKEDPLSVPTVVLRYEIANHYQVEYPVISERDNMATIKQAYMAAIVSEAVFEEMEETLGEALSSGYYAEVVSVSETTNGFNVQVTHYDRESCEKMADIVKRVIDSAQPEIIQTCGEHDMNLVGQSYQNRVDQNLIVTQQGKLTQLSDLRDLIAGLSAEFSEEECAYYDFLRGEEIVEEEEAADESQQTAEVTPGSPIKIKYILVGAVGGIILAFCWFAFRYIIDARLHTEEDIRYFGGLQSLGTVPLPGERKLFLHAIDCWIEKWMYRDKSALSYEDSIRLIASYLEVLTAQKGYNRLFITGCRWNDKSEQLAKALKELLENSGLSVRMMSNINLNGEAMKEASAAEGIVLLEELGHTRYDELEHEQEICASNNLPVLGVIVGKTKIALAE